MQTTANTQIEKHRGEKKHESNADPDLTFTSQSYQKADQEDCLLKFHLFMFEF